MRRLLFVLAATALAGCQSMYDEAAREECDNTTGARERGACYDRVDENSRDQQQDRE